MALMTLTAYARKCGVSTTAIQKRIKSGTITERAVIRSNGKIVQINSVLADNDFAKNGDPVQVHAQKAAKEMKAEKKAQEVSAQQPVQQEQPPQQVQAEVLPKEDKREFADAKAPRNEITKEVHDGKEVPVENVAYNNDLDRYKKAKASTEELKARKIEFEILELEGKLVDVDEVKARIAKLIVEVKDAILNVPSKAGPDLLACNELVELENKLLEHLNQALSGLSRVENEKFSK